MQIRRFDKRWLGRRTPSPRRTTSEGRSSKSPSIISALIMLLLPLAGVISGGLITYFSSQQLEEGKNLIKLRTQAYVDYTQSVIRLASLNRGESRDNTKPASENSKSESDAVIAAQDARVRIGLYGSKKVTERFAEYLDVIENNKGDGPAAQERFLRCITRCVRRQTTTRVLFHGSDYVGCYSHVLNRMERA